MSEAEPCPIHSLYFDVRRHFPFDWTVAGSQPYHKNLKVKCRLENTCALLNKSKISGLKNDRLSRQGKCLPSQFLKLRIYCLEGHSPPVRKYKEGKIMSNPKLSHI